MMSNSSASASSTTGDAGLGRGRTIELAHVSARGAAERGRARAALVNVSLEHGSGVLGIIGAHKDGTSVLLDVLEGSVTAKTGLVLVHMQAPEKSRARIARVSLDAFLPDALRVEEVCDLAGELRGEPHKPAVERLAVLGVATLAKRRVRSLTIEERRAVALAIAISSKAADVLLIEEPLISIDPVAPRLVIDALRARADEGACVIVTTASPRDATRIADRLGVLTNGAYAPLPVDVAHVGHNVGGMGVSEGAAVMRVVVTPSAGSNGASKLIAALSNDAAVTRVETQTARSGSVALVVSGRDLVDLSSAITHAIGAARVDVELVEATVLPLDAIRAALAARAPNEKEESASPPLAPAVLPPAPAPAAADAGSIAGTPMLADAAHAPTQTQTEEQTDASPSPHDDNKAGDP